MKRSLKVDKNITVLGKLLSNSETIDANANRKFLETLTRNSKIATIIGCWYTVWCAMNGKKFRLQIKKKYYVSQELVDVVA